jgi:hypothetical protein
MDQLVSLHFVEVEERDGIDSLFDGRCEKEAFIAEIVAIF